MYARMSSYEVPDEREHDAAGAFADALSQVSECPGFMDGFYLVSCDGERALTLTLWESRDRMEASRVKASRLRSEASHQVDAAVVSTEEFRVDQVQSRLQRLRIDVNGSG